jgi:hypothetical protein
MSVPKRLVGRAGLATAVVAALVATGMLAVDVSDADARSRTLAALLDRYETSSTGDGKEVGDASDGAGGSPGDSGVQDPRVGRVVGRSLFAPRPPEPTKGLSAPLVGVLGDRAYFQGHPTGFAVGESFGEATIVEIGPTWAKVDIDGNRQTCTIAGGAPSNVDGGPAPSPSAPPGSSMEGSPPGSSPGPGPMPEQTPEGPVRLRKLPPGVRERMMEWMRDGMPRDSKRP